MTHASNATLAWPPLTLEGCGDTLATLHRWTQIVGKTRLALSPPENHWWHVAQYVTARGLTTSPMPYRRRTLEVEFDFIDHQLKVRASDGAVRTLALEPRTVADFYGAYADLLRSLDVEVRIHPVPSEIADSPPLDQDREHGAYDAAAARGWWDALVNADRALKSFRGSFIGKCSPVHFWWGSFDLSCTRFSGRRAPPHPGGIPNLPDWITREAYSHECISAGWWPGNPGGPVAEPSFYAYAYPEPPGCSQAPLDVDGAAYHPVLREWILPYDAVRRAPDPDATIQRFLRRSYEVAAELGGWDRAALERDGAS